MGSWWWDPRADNVTWSEGLYRIVGADPKLPPPRFKDQARYYTPDSLARLNDAVESSIQTGRPYTLELEMVRAGGAIRSVTARGEVDRDASGQLALVRGIFHDITELKRAEDEARLLAALQAVVADLGQRALRAYRLQDTFDETVALVAPAIDVEFCKVLELLKDQNVLLLRSGVGWTEGLVGRATVGAGKDSQAGFTLMCGEPVIVHDIKTERRFSGSPLLHEHGVVSGISVVIPTSEGPYGVLGVHTRQRRTFSRDEVHFLESIANVLGSMIERTSTEEALRESEVNLTRAQAIAHIGSWHLDVPRNRLTWSDEVYRIFGVPRETALTYETFLAGVHPEDKERVNQAWTAALNGELYDIEHRLVVGDAVKWVREIARVQFDDAGKAIEGDGTVQDITERKSAEIELHRATRAQLALSRCNQALIRATDEPTLLQQICQIVVEEAGYPLCWVGSAENDAARSIRPVARAGIDNGFLEGLNLTWADSERGRGPTGTCIRTQEIVLSSDIAADPKMAIWRDEALKRGYGSCIAIPLTTDGVAFGALDIYAASPGEFGVEEIELLTELASDLAFGITALRTRDQRARAEQEVLTLNAELEQRVIARTAELEAANKLKDELIVRQQATSAELAKAREKEIEIGYRIQQTLLLDRPPGDLAGLRVAALTIPSQRIDGDFYGFFKHPDQRLDVIVGDVMGKGIPAALLGAATKGHFIEALSHLLSLSRNGRLPSPREIVTLAHAEVARHLISLESFVTLCYARLDLNQRTIDLVDCGHTGIIHLSAKTGTCTVVHGENLPLGIREGEIFDQVSVPFNAGDVMIFYSDGVTEARSRAGELFGTDRLLHCVTSNSALEPEALVGAIRDAAVAFSEPGQLTDDLTCVAIKIDEVPTPLAQAEREIRSELEELSRAREFVRAFCADTPELLDQDKLAELELAITEAASNIIKHAYHGRSDQTIQLEAEAFEKQVILRLCHLGDAFDPRAVCLPSLDFSRESGFGLFLMAGTADEIRYYRDERGRNCIALVKNR
jgi:serine phosphatase RsbU (regulator of sigma subunit)/PAS domain-containing protein/anti-sigma regulatory factor (Ser/Thr protein kinase)